MQYRDLSTKIQVTVYELQTYFQQFQGIYFPFLYAYPVNTN